jgi:hypothetical protein
MWNLQPRGRVGEVRGKREFFVGKACVFGHHQGIWAHEEVAGRLPRVVEEGSLSELTAGVWRWFGP